MSAVFAIFYYLLLQIKSNKHEEVLCVCVIILGLVLGISVNPIRVGLDTLTESEYGKAVEEINEEDEGIWIAQNISGNFLIAFGAKTINSTNTYPNLELWKKFDVDDKNEDIYNRFAHIEINLSNDKENKFELMSNDVFQFNTNIDTLYEIGVKYIFNAQSSKNTEELQGEKCKIEEIYSKQDVKIYKLVDINN
jgi:hypothetical protein